eukprot:175679-Prymnesium_polylepis.1
MTCLSAALPMTSSSACRIGAGDVPPCPSVCFKSPVLSAASSERWVLCGRAGTDCGSDSALTSAPTVGLALPLVRGAICRTP